MPKNPTQHTGVITQEAGAETMLYHLDDTTVHVLNETARTIWELCDGQHTPADIVQSLRNTFEVPPGFDLEDSVRHILAQLSGLGLLQDDLP